MKRKEQKELAQDLILDSIDGGYSWSYGLEMRMELGEISEKNGALVTLEIRRQIERVSKLFGYEARDEFLPI